MTQGTLRLCSVSGEASRTAERLRGASGTLELIPQALRLFGESDGVLATIGIQYMRAAELGKGLQGALAAL